MMIYPAIDLRGGQVVRLKEGDLDQQTVFSDDPIATAQKWIDLGAQWLHIVNLDGAFENASDNLSVMSRIAALGVPVQFGGGLRDLENIDAALSLGASRVVIGTAAVKNPPLVTEAVRQFGAERMSVGLDSRDGKVTTNGWQTASDFTPAALGNQMAKVGVKHALFTDVSRDGLLGGCNVEATIALGRDTGLNVIASGGVSTLDEIRVLARSGVVAGAIIGMALYTGTLDLTAVLDAAKES